MMRFWCVLLLCLVFSMSLYAQIPIEEEDSSSSFSSQGEAVSDMTVEQRVAKLERQMRTQANMFKQMDVISQQVKDLQGQLEVETHEIKILKDQQKSQYSDLDQRLSNLPQQKEAHSDSTVNKKTDNATENNAKAASSDAQAEDKGQKAYQAAYALLKNKNYDKAKSALQKFIHAYPNDANIANAYYWLGNIYLLKNQPDKAIVQFKMAIKTDVQQAKTADALFKLGLAYSMQGNTQQARIQFKKVKQSYPNTQAAKLASEKLKNSEA